MTAETITFALGCFWDPDAKFGVLDGVLTTQVGYCGGTHPPNPTYHSIGDYTESVQIVFDPSRISFRQLLDCYNNWHVRNTDRTRSQYAGAIFYHNKQQYEEIRQVNIEHIRIDLFKEFYPAEEYHQKYSLKRAILETELFGRKEDWETKEKEMLTKLNGF